MKLACSSLIINSVFAYPIIPKKTLEGLQVPTYNVGSTELIVGMFFLQTPIESAAGTLTSKKDFVHRACFSHRAGCADLAYDLVKQK